MSKTLSLALLGSLALVGCGGSKEDTLSFLSNHAVGTYIGGGSMFGADSCTYAGSPAGVFVDKDGKPSTEAAEGPRFVLAAGTITKVCKGGTTKVAAVVPTGVKLTGPSKLAVGATNTDLFQGRLVANGKELGGEANIEWKLGNDCNGVAEFGPVLGAQDTGGRDRSRTLVTKAKGSCTVIVQLTTGDALDPSFKPQSFQAEKLVTIQ